MDKYASILDYSFPGIPTDIWLSDGMLNPVHTDFVMKLLNSFYSSYGLKNPEQWVTDITVIGSLTTNKFVRTSDFDCHVIVDVDKFIETNMPDASKEEAVLYLDNARKEWDRAKILMPLGEHALELFFETQENPSNVEHVGRYSIFQSKWLKEPIYFAQDLDYEESRKQAIEGAKALASELDVSFGEIGRQIQRIDELKAVLQAWPKDKRQLYYDKIQKKLDIIEEEIEKSIQIKQDLVDTRHEKQDAFSENEIQFKFLARFHYFAILQDLKDLMESLDNREVTVQELPLIEKIINEGSIKESKKLTKNDSEYWDAKLIPIADDLKKDILPKIREFSNFQVLDAKVRGHGIAEFQSGSSKNPIIYIDGLKSEKLIKKFPEYTFDSIVYTSIVHELGHALQEAHNLPYDEQDAEDFANTWNFNLVRGKKIASIKEAFFKEVFAKETDTQIAIDFDGTIAKDKKFPNMGEPNEGVKEALSKIKEMGYTILIYSCRSRDEEGLEAIREYLDKHEIPYDSIFEGEKPFAKFYIDDRAIHFDSWNNVLKQVEKSEKKASLSVVSYEKKIFQDPTEEQANTLLQNSKTKMLRWAIGNDGHLYMWDAYYLDHPMARAKLGIDWTLENSGYYGERIYPYSLGQYWKNKQLSIVAAAKIYTRDELERLDIDDLDRMAYGYASGDILQLEPSQINIQYPVDLSNPEYKFEQNGMDWIKSVDLSKPVKVSIKQNGKFYLEDGHHRWFAANKLGLPLMAEIEVKAKPIETILQRQEAVDYALKQQNAANRAVAGSLNKIARDVRKLWYDPSGQMYDISPSGSHADWILSNADMLKNEYGFDSSGWYRDNYGDIKDFQGLNAALISTGWSRVGDVENGWGIEVADVHMIPDYLRDIVTKTGLNGEVIFEDINKQWVIVDINDFIREGQKAANKALQRKRLQTASLYIEAIEWPAAFWISPDGQKYEALTHDAWMLDNIKLLKQKYNFDLSQYDQDDLFDAVNDLVRSGWTRVSISPNGKDYLAEVANVQNVPTVAVDILLSSPSNNFLFESPDTREPSQVTREELAEGQTEITRNIKRAAFSKKEAKRITWHSNPVGFWVTPDNQLISIRDGKKSKSGVVTTTHDEWSLANKELIQEFGTNILDNPDGYSLSERMMDDGWSRIGDAGGGNFGIQVPSFGNISSAVDNAIASFFKPGMRLEVWDRSGNAIGITDPFPTLQKAIKKNYRKAAKLSSKRDLTAQTKKVKQGDYGCIMTLVPHDLAQEIVAWGVRHIPDDKLFMGEDRPLGRELESHITIKYGLITDDAKTVRRLFNDEKPYHATLGKVKHFQPPELPFDVVTVEIISDDLQKANKKVEDTLECAEGLPSDEYHPHITIAYVKRDSGKEFIGSTEFEGKEIVLDTVIFSPAKGNRTYFSVSQDKESQFILEKINKFSAFSDSVWIDPKGKLYKINSSHEDWAIENQEFLEKTYGLSWNSSYATVDLLHNGWVRIGDIGVGTTGFGIELDDLARVPSFVLDYIFSNLKQDDLVAIADEQNRFIELPVKDFVNGQKDLNRELFLNRAAKLNKKAEEGEYWFDPSGKAHFVDVNHDYWVRKNAKVLQDTYGIDTSVLQQLMAQPKWSPADSDIQDASEDIWQQMFQTGWVRIGGMNDDNVQFYIALWDVNNIPSFVDDFIAQNFKADGWPIDVASEVDEDHFLIDDPFPTLHKAISRSMDDIPEYQEKAAEFLPSLVNAPDNKWQFAEGGPDKEIALQPQPMSDEETLYEPCTTGKPRSKDVWRQFMSIFRNPISKKDNVTVESSEEKLINIGNITLRKKSFPLEVPEQLLEKYFNLAVQMENGLWENDTQLEVLDRERQAVHNALVQSIFDRIFEGKNWKDFPAVGHTIRDKISDFVEDMVPRDDLKDMKIGSEKVSYDKELEEAEKNALGEEETLLEYSKGFYDPKKHDFPKNTQWFQTYQDQEPSKPLPVTYSPQISNEDNLDQNSPGGFPRRFMGKPKGEWFSNEGEVNDILVNMLKNREAAIDTLTVDVTASSNVFFLETDSGLQTKAIKNPTSEQAENLFNSLRGEVKQLRYFIDSQGNLYMWDAYDLTHWDALKQMGIPSQPDIQEDKNIGILRSIQEVISLVSKLENRELLNKKQAGVQSASVPDYLMDEWKIEQIHDDTDSEPYVNHDQRDFPYGMHDSPENTGSGIGWPKDETKYVVRLDQIENPADRNFPPGLMDYNVEIYYNSAPASDGIEKGNP